MDGFRHVPLLFLLSLILGCLLSSSKAVPLSQEEIEYEDFLRSGFRKMPNHVAFSAGPNLMPTYRRLENFPPLPSREITPGPRKIHEGTPLSTEVASSGPKFRQMQGESIIVTNIKRILGLLRSLADMFIADIQDDEKWEALREMVIKIAETIRIGLDFVSSLSILN